MVRSLRDQVGLGSGGVVLEGFLGGGVGQDEVGHGRRRVPNLTHLLHRYLGAPLRQSSTVELLSLVDKVVEGGAVVGDDLLLLEGLHHL